MEDPACYRSMETFGYASIPRPGVERELSVLPSWFADVFGVIER